MRGEWTRLPVICLTANAYRPGSRLLPFASLKQKHRSAFLLPTRTKQFVRSPHRHHLLPPTEKCRQKNPACRRIKIMRGGGLEPPSREACAPQTHAYTNSATRAKKRLYCEGNAPKVLVYFSKINPRWQNPAVKKRQTCKLSVGKPRCILV